MAPVYTTYATKRFTAVRENGSLVAAALQGESVGKLRGMRDDEI